MSCRYIDVMAHTKLEMGIIFLTWLGVGLFGNSSFLCLWNLTLPTGHKVRPTDVIASQVFSALSWVLFQTSPSVDDH